jgi:hypothetical protein
MEVVEIFHNLHNVYVKTGIATKEQLANSVNIFKKKLCDMFPDKSYDKCEILINLVIAKNQSAKYGYLWIENPEVYFIICGFNPDGSQRVEEYIEVIEKEDELEDLDDLDLNDVISKKQKNTVKILKPLPPILELSSYEYTEEQAEIVHKEMIDEENRIAVSEGRTPNEILKPKLGFFECSRADATSIPKGMSYNTLWGKVPHWVNDDMIRSVFYRYNEDTKQFKITMGNPCKEGNPPNFKEVTICYGNTKRGVATFALQMTRKNKFINPSSKEEVECIFNYLKLHNDKDSATASSYVEHRYKKNTGFLTRVNENNFMNRSK